MAPVLQDEELRTLGSQSIYNLGAWILTLSVQVVLIYGLKYPKRPQSPEIMGTWTLRVRATNSLEDKVQVLDGASRVLRPETEILSSLRDEAWQPVDSQRLFNCRALGCM